MRYWPGAQWRKDPSPSTWPPCAVSKLELLGLCVAQGGFWVPSAWTLVECWLLQCRRELCTAPRHDRPPAPLLGSLAAPGLVPALMASPRPARSSPAPCWQCGESSTAGLAPRAVCKMTIQILARRQGLNLKQLTNPSLSGNHFSPVQKTSLFTSRTQSASPSLSSPSKCRCSEISLSSPSQSNNLSFLHCPSPA